MERFPMTEKGLAKLQAELESWRDRRPQVAADVARFREMGDLRENGDYHAAREELSMIDAKVAQLEGKIGSAEIIRGEADADTVVFGTRVPVQESGARK
ncbi:MAG: transcription elongation factor GreA, partial [Planctomycetes bacterium]|nr:transcription elongation factor GreA [Planctomycetota bacterium]